MVTTATSPATNRSPMNYPAWRPTGNTRTIPTLSIHTQALVHIQAQDQGTPGQAMKPIPWQTQLACLQLEEWVLEEDRKTVSANNLILVTQEMEEMGVEMGAQQPHRQRNPLEGAKCPQQTLISNCRVPEATAITWALETILLSI